MRFIYNFLFFIFSLIYLPFFLIKGKHKSGFSQRFGYVPEDILSLLKNHSVIWVHAVSVGEVALAVRLIGGLKQRFQNARIVLTTTTMAGHEVAKRSLSDEDVLLYFPIDFRGSVRRFIGSVAPKAVIILETEIWPNLIWELSDKKIPICSFDFSELQALFSKI